MTTHEALLAQAAQARRIMADASYQVGSTTIDLRLALAACLTGTRMIRSEDWEAMFAAATVRCTASRPRPVTMAAETTLAALRRLTAVDECGVAALNFDSARRPGGGWDGGALAQEESLARASCLVVALARAPEYYQENRRHAHLFYTDHAIWSPAVPFFADAHGDLLPQPMLAGIITMPAPNVGAMLTLDEADLQRLPRIWRHRLRCVLALAIHEGVHHLVLGAWGCGAFGNDPLLVARRMREVLDPAQPWRRGLASVTIAIHDTTRRQACLEAFRAAMADIADPSPRVHPHA
jgi:uncharacterized protein (TIGR02452 family)